VTTPNRTARGPRHHSMPAPRSTLRHTLTLAALAALAAGLTWFALCCWTQWLYADLHRIIWNGAQSPADVLDWRWAQLHHPDSFLIMLLAKEPTFSQALDIWSQSSSPPARRLWPHLAQAAAIVAAATGPLFALLLMAARSVARRWLGTSLALPVGRSAFLVPDLAGAVLAAAPWYASVPRKPMFPLWLHAHLTSFHAPLAALLAGILLVFPLLLAWSVSQHLRRRVTAPTHLPTRCPRCGYDARHANRCPECGLLAADTVALQRSRLRRFVLIHIASIALATALAFSLAAHAAADPSKADLAARIGQWLRIRHPEFTFEGRILPLRVDAVTEITLADGQRWELLPVWFQVTTPEDLARYGSSHLGHGVLAKPVANPVAAPPPSPAVFMPDPIIRNLPTPDLGIPGVPVWLPRKGTYPLVTTQAPSVPPSTVVFAQLNAAITALRVRPMHPVSTSSPPNPAHGAASQIEDDLAAQLAARQWRHVPPPSLPQSQP
jgi:hypothetical protein